MKALNQHSLLQRQQHLVENIFKLSEAKKNNSLGYTKGLRAYQHNVLMTASRSLSITYPVLEKMLGEKAIRVLARTLLQYSPPTEGDWAMWGAELANCLKETTISKENPYLIDIAELEWAIHRISRMPITRAPIEKLALLTENNLQQIKIHLSPAVAFLSSAYPIDAIWQAHQPQKKGKLALQNLKKAIQQHNDNCFIVIKQVNHRPQINRLTQQEYRWAKDVAEGYSLSALLTKHPNCDFVHWLPEAMGNHSIKNISIS